MSKRNFLFCFLALDLAARLVFPGSTNSVIARKPKMHKVNTRNIGGYIFLVVVFASGFLWSVRWLTDPGNPNVIFQSIVMLTINAIQVKMTIDSLSD